MNDQSPRRYRGTLVERAAEYFHYGEPESLPDPLPEAFAPSPAHPRPAAPPPPEPAAHRPAPVPEPETPELIVEQAAPAPAEPEVEAEPRLRRGSELELTPDLAPAIEPRSHRQAPIDRKILAEHGMIVPDAPIGVLAEEFRLIKRQLLLTARAVAGADADRARMILVCSARPDEGKTFCAINLALSMAAEKDVEILLVDADFAKPDVLERLGLPEGPGLLDALSGAIADVEACVIETDVPQLSVLPAGTKSHSDTELIASERARAILDGLAAANPKRIVIYDSPPVLAASPASVLALHAGQAMLVVRADSTTETDLREAVSLLEGCEHIQLVLNSVSFQPGGRRFGSYYGEAVK